MTSAQPLPTATAASPIQLPLHLQRIALAGFMGAGKSTIGRSLARQLGWDFLDLDAHLESRAGSSISDLFAQHGESHFRRLESAALASALARRNTVLALGGGTPELLTNRLLLEQTPGTVTVFLDAPFEALFDRCVLQGIDRPVFADAERARARFLERQPWYRRLARITLNTEFLTPHESVFALLPMLEKLQPTRR